MPLHPFKLARWLSGAWRAGRSPRTLDDLAAWTARCPVLYVDDDVDVLLLLRFYLEDAGLHVITTSDSPSVPELVRRVPISLVISDITMPEVDGYMLCTMLHSDPMTAAVPVMFVTSLSNLEVVVTGFEYGAVGYAMLPVSPAQFIGLVHEVLLEHGHWHRPAGYDPALAAQVIRLDGPVPTRPERPAQVQLEPPVGPVFPARLPFRRDRFMRAQPPERSAGYYTLHNRPPERS